MALSIFVGRNGVRYSEPEAWRELVEDGRLRREDSVAVRRGDAPLERARAEDVPELRALFDDFDGVTTASERPPAAEPIGTATPTPPEQPPPPPAEIDPWDQPPPPRPAVTAVPLTPPPSAPPRPEPPPIPAPPQRMPSPPPARAQPPAARRRRGIPIWLWLIAAGAALFFLNRTLNDGPVTSDPATAQPGEIVRMYAQRETRVRRVATSRGNTPIADVARGEALRGEWVTGEDGSSRWLKISEGRYAGNFAWGANLAAGRPPRLSPPMDTERVIAREVVMRERAEADAPRVDDLSPGLKVRVAGELDNGWFEIVRGAGGVAYVPPDAFDREETLDITVEDFAQPDPEPASTAPAPAPASSPPTRIVEASPTLEKRRERPAPPRFVAAPDWEREPSPLVRARNIPLQALERGEGGRATMECRVDETGALTGCGIVEEDPPGLGFGSATLALAPHYRMRVVDRAGDPVGGRRIRIPARYEVR